MKSILAFGILLAFSPAYAATASNGSGQMSVQLNAASKLKLIEAVKHVLKDPDSAQFKWTPMPMKWEIDTMHNGHHFQSGSYCGMVNAKNSFGGYVGFSPYESSVILQDGTIVFATSPLMGKGGDDGWIARLCKNQTGIDPLGAE